MKPRISMITLGVRDLGASHLNGAYQSSPTRMLLT
jgi:hypothetical protein